MKVFAVVAAALAALIPSSASAGYVKTSGSAFELDGKPFHVFGTNAYWASETKWSTDQLDKIFGSMAADGLTVCRLWGFNDATYASGVYYQLWQNGNPTINTGSDGLAYFDLVVAAAKKHGVKLVVPFVNNWQDYGGMDVYVQQLGGKYHDDFYTMAAAKTAFKNYVKTFVTRYQNDDTIMSWQACNECRCGGSGLPQSGKCTTATVTSWLAEMAQYIKSLDKNHLVSAGDEGFYNNDKNQYPYSGYDGVDFNKNLAIASIDYGTYHAYPDSWGISEQTAKSWGLKWIKDHIASGIKAGKPVILEEYGAKSKDVSLYQEWSDAVYAGRSGMQYWQYGLRSLGSTDDGFTVYTEDSLFNSTIRPMARQFKERK